MAGPHHLVRNPVFDASQQVAAYELRGRPHASSEAEAGALLQAVQSPGLIHLVCGHDLLLPLPGAFLFQEFDNLLPSKQIILLVPAPESGQEGLEEAIACRRKEGFRIGFEVADVERADRDVLRHADFLRFDLQDFGDLSALTTAAAHLRAMEAPWVVQGLNSRDEVQQCQALGFSLFQGLFFTEPAVFSTDPVQPRQAALLEIFRKLGEGAEFDEIERTFKAYPDLCLQLLDLLNSAAFRRNEPIYSITITPASYDQENTPILAELMDVPVKEVKKRIKEARSYSMYRSSRLFTEVDFKTFSVIQENIWQLPGIGHQIESKRHYPVDSLQASHLLGYLREVSKEEYLKTKSYHLGDKVGKSGLEMSYEEHLRGALGTRYIRVNAMGQNLGSYQDGAIDESPQKGSDLYTSIDTELQLLAEDLMKGKRGAVVALNPNDGSVLSMVSAPQYDIRKLSGRIDFDYWQSVNADTTNPLYNRAISGKQPPGSTFKPLMALMGLELDIISSDVVAITG